MRLIKPVLYILCVCITFPPAVAAAPEAVSSNELEERYILMQEEEMHVKQMRSDEIAQHVTAMKRQMEEERLRIRQANEKIWEEFLNEQELKRANLENQLSVIDERQRRFEHELEKKRSQDNFRFTNREHELKRLVLEMQRLHAELQEDSEVLDKRMEAYNERKRQAAKHQSKFTDLDSKGRRVETKGEMAVLANHAIKIGGFEPGELMGSQPFHLRRPSNEYFLEIGDIIEIEVWRVADLTRIITVRPDGRISMPLVGDLDVEGMSLTQLRDVLTEKISDYVISPQISISLKQFGGRKFVILGEVNSPGVFRYQQQIYMMEAIALAGGFKHHAKSADVMIVRGDIRKQPKVKIIRANMNNVLKKGMLTENIAILPNDIIYIGKGAIGDANDVISDVIEPMFSNIIDFFVMRAAIRTAQQKGV